MHKKAKKMQNLKTQKNSKTASLAALSAVAFFANLLLPGLTLGQTDMSIDVTRTPYLSFLSIPESFSFGSIPASISDTNVFSDDNGPLSAAHTIVVHDTRGSGGFTLQAVASGPFVASGAPSNTIPAANLRMVTSGTLSIVYDAIQNNGIYYLSGFVGTPDNASVQTVLAPLRATSTNFGTVTPFDEVEASPINNRLDTTVTLMDGCLTETEGRFGYMATGVSDTLLIPKYQQPGEYATTVTYTLTDNTPTSC